MQFNSQDYPISPPSRPIKVTPQNNIRLDEIIYKFHYGLFQHILSFLTIKEVFLKVKLTSKLLSQKLDFHLDLVSKEKIQKITGVSTKQHPEIYRLIKEKQNYYVFLQHLYKGLQSNRTFFIHINTYIQNQMTNQELEIHKKKLQELINLQEQLLPLQVSDPQFIETQNQREFQLQQKTICFRQSNLTSFTDNESNFSISIQKPFLVINRISICRQGEFIYPAKTCAVYSTMSCQKSPKVNTKLEEQVNCIKDQSQLKQFILNNRQLKVAQTNIKELENISSIFDTGSNINPSELQYVLFDPKYQQNAIIPPTSHKQHMQYYEWFVATRNNIKSTNSLEEQKNTIAEEDNDDDQVLGYKNEENKDIGDINYDLDLSDCDFNDEIFTNKKMSIDKNMMTGKQKQDDEYNVSSGIKLEKQNFNLENKNRGNSFQRGQKRKNYTNIFNPGSQQNIQFQKNQNDFNKNCFLKQNKRKNCQKQLSLQDLDSASNLSYQLEYEGDFNIIGWFKFEKKKTQRIDFDKNYNISGRQFRVQLIDFTKKQDLIDAIPGDVNLNYIMFGGQQIM